ncbi:MAG: DUF3046 domain-containing protein [Dermatophilus congolensis]|nr:DUF3046 domain-containing protein [Dermatophilus congolensis]
MRLSEFWRRMDDEFGPTYSRTLAAHQALTAFGARTVQELIDAGESPRDVWEALAEQMDVPPERRLGKDLPLRERPDFY